MLRIMSSAFLVALLVTSIATLAHAPSGPPLVIGCLFWLWTALRSAIQSTVPRQLRLPDVAVSGFDAQGNYLPPRRSEARTIGGPQTKHLVGFWLVDGVALLIILGCTAASLAHIRL